MLLKSRALFSDLEEELGDVGDGTGSCTLHRGKEEPASPAAPHALLDPQPSVHPPAASHALRPPGHPSQPHTPSWPPSRPSQPAKHHRSQHRWTEPFTSPSIHGRPAKCHQHARKCELPCELALFLRHMGIPGSLSDPGRGTRQERAFALHGPKRQKHQAMSVYLLYFTIFTPKNLSEITVRLSRICRGGGFGW